jgi:hypothetical protein
VVCFIGLRARASWIKHESESETNTSRLGLYSLLHFFLKNQRYGKGAGKLLKILNAHSGVASDCMYPPVGYGCHGCRPRDFFTCFSQPSFAATASPCAALRGDGWPDGDVHGGPEHAAAVLRLFSCHQAPPASQLHGRPARARPGRCDASLEPQRHQNLVA